MKRQSIGRDAVDSAAMTARPALLCSSKRDCDCAFTHHLEAPPEQRGDHCGDDGHLNSVETNITVTTGIVATNKRRSNRRTSQQHGH